MKWLRTNQAGYTLIELLLYVTIVSSLLLGITVFYGMMNEVHVENQTITEVNQQGTAAMEQITQSIRNASSVTAPAVAATGNSLTLVVPAAAASPTIFDMNGTTLQMKEGTAAAIALTNSKVQISGLTFKNLARTGTDGVIQVSFTVTRVNTSGRAEYDYQKTFTSSAAIR